MKIYIALALVLAAILAGCGAPDYAGAPEVKGFNLAQAEKTLKRAGYKPMVTENDGVFGIVIHESFTVCEQQDTTAQKVVPLKVAKHGC